MGHRTISCRLGQENGLVGIQQLRTFAHELNARENDGFLRQFHRQFGKIERIADIISHRLNLRLHVIMGEDNRVTLGLQPIDRCHQRWIGNLSGKRIQRCFTYGAIGPTARILSTPDLLRRRYLSFSLLPSDGFNIAHANTSPSSKPHSFVTGLSWAVVYHRCLHLTIQVTRHQENETYSKQ